MNHLKFDNQLVSKGKTDKAYILGMPFSKERKIVGSIPPGAGTFTIKGAIDNPAQLFKNMLIKKLQKEKIDFVFNDNISSENIFASKEYMSQELQKIITVTNQNSNNLYAEALLKTIGLEKYGYASAANGLKAIEALYEIVTTKWSRFTNIEQIAINEMNQVIAANPLVNTDFIDSALLKHLPVDMRVVLNWDADATDIDLWVTDPTGEKCFYSHNRTKIGGFMTNDFTQGYGPEVFMIKRGMKGKYKSSHSNE